MAKEEAYIERTVIRNAIVLSMDPTIGEHLDADLLIDGEKIAAVRPNIGSVDGHEIDGKDMIVMPGFVDTHRHTWQSLLRNTATDWRFAQYFGGVRGVMGELYTPEDMYIANHVGALEALDAGITTLVDWSHNNNTPDHADMAVKGLKDAGLRAVFAYGNANREWFPISELPTNFADLARVRKQHFSSDDGLVTMAFAARGPQFTTLDHTEMEFRKARELDLPITLHVGDGLWGLKNPIDQLNSRGLLGPRTTYVHCCTLSDNEFKLMADRVARLAFRGGRAKHGSWQPCDPGMPQTWAAAEHLDRRLYFCRRRHVCSDSNSDGRKPRRSERGSIEGT